MNKDLSYIPQKDRKKIMLMGDDIRVHSGVGNMGREIVINTSHHFNWVNIGAAIKHPEEGKIIDISAEVNKFASIDDASVKIIPSDGYGNPDKLRQYLALEKPDAIFLFTDPRYWVWLFEMEREIRNKIPIIYLNIWDNYPAPMYNLNYYNSVDGLLAISKQTLNINKIVLGEKAKNKVLEYVPHGVSSDIFYPIDLTDDNQKSKFFEFKKTLFKGKEIDFVVLFNSRNIRRKNPGDVILAYRRFCDLIGKDKASRCALIMHTAVSDDNGTDLLAVKRAFCDPEYVNVYFSTERLDTAQMNLLYNVADVNVLISSNEGWGLSLTEAVMSGTMIVPNVTGGMQDQCRFEDENGKWIEFNDDFPSNHLGKYSKCGEWAVPVFPYNRSLIGSPPTPYIFDDRCDIEEVATALAKVYSIPKEERAARGLKGREWMMSEEAGMTSNHMGKRIIKYCDEVLNSFTPRSTYDLVKIEERPSKYVKHKLFDY